MDNKIIQKYDIEKTFKERLKVFFVIVRSAQPMHSQSERIVGIVAYKPEDAMAKMNADYKGQLGISIISYGDFILVEDILSSVNAKSKITTINPVVVNKPVKQPVLGVAGFKAGLVMASEEYIKDVKHKAFLKEIINNIK